MKFLKKLLNHLKKDNGITGADVAVAITVIVTVMGVVTAIYVNVIHQSRDNIRQSNATRIATSIVETIESSPYDYVIYKCSSNDSDDLHDNSKQYSYSGSKEDGSESIKLFGVTIPNGYTATVTATPVQDASLDILRDIKVEVSYKSFTRSKTITLYTTKEKELLEQTNPPNISDIEDYGKAGVYYYPIKKVENKYIITDINDPEWYNYDIGNYALLYTTTSSDLKIGDEFGTTNNINFYVWIPRYGLDQESNLCYCYKTSEKIMEYSQYQGEIGKSLYGYMLVGPEDSPERLAYEGITKDVDNYATIEENGTTKKTFQTNDGLSGVWYQIGNENADSLTYVIAKDFNSRNSCKNANLPQ